jgi:hypothetical protein
MLEKAEGLLANGKKKCAFVVRKARAKMEEAVGGH